MTEQRVKQLETGYDELRTVCNRQQQTIKELVEALDWYGGDAGGEWHEAHCPHIEGQIANLPEEELLPCPERCQKARAILAKARGES